jgi:hypothetical protein
MLLNLDLPFDPNGTSHTIPANLHFSKKSSGILDIAKEIPRSGTLSNFPIRNYCPLQGSGQFLSYGPTNNDLRYL